METQQSTSIPLHRPGRLEMASYFIQGLIVSVAISVTLETVARNYIATVIPGDIGYVLLVSVFAPLIEEFTKVFPLLFRHTETEKSIVRLGLLAGLGFGLAEFAVYVFALGAPVAIRFPEMLFHASNAAIVAYGIAKHRFTDFYLLAVGMHFVNNFSAFFGDIWVFIGTATFALSYYLAWTYYRKSSDSFLE